jgi:dienelactone hydrolase
LSRRRRAVSSSSPTAAAAAGTVHATSWSRRNFNARGSTLLFDLLTRAEEETDVHTREHRFDIGLLAQRLIDGTQWIAAQDELRTMRVGYFGASTGSAAALVAAAKLGARVGAVVSRGGRPDLAGAANLAVVKAPTLLLVGSSDEKVLELNQSALEYLNCEKQLTVVPRATHLFEEPGTLESSRPPCRSVVPASPLHLTAEANVHAVYGSQASRTDTRAKTGASVRQRRCDRPRAATRRGAGCI